jgi:hypothetical protein
MGKRMNGKRFFWLVALSILWLSCAPLAAQSGSATPDGRFLRWDKNKDNRLSRDELPLAIRGNFDRVDADRSGWISMEEHSKFLNRKAGSSDGLPAKTKTQKNLAYVDQGHEVPSLSTATDYLGPWRRLEKRVERSICPFEFIA